MATLTTSLRCSRPLVAARASRRPAVRTAALFGWGKNDEKKAELDEAYRVQQELLEARRNGSLIKQANDRRRKVQEDLASRKAARQAEKDSLAKGEIPDSLKEWKPYSSKRDEEAMSGIVVPLLPFGIQKYDEGERFDLRSPYADDGWVDPDETDMFAGFKKIGKKILNFSGNNDEYREQLGKPILWAKDYERQKGEKEKEKKKGGK